MPKFLLKGVLFFQFLGELRKRDRRFFLFVLSSIFVQIFVNASKLEITPFVLHGMYSNKITPIDSVRKVEILLDNQNLEDLDIPVREKLVLQTNVDNYLAIKANDGVDPFQDQVETKLPFIRSSFIYENAKEQLFNTAGELKKFPVWFKDKCAVLARRKLNTVDVIETTYYLSLDPLHATKHKRVVLARF